MKNVLAAFMFTCLIWLPSTWALAQNLEDIQWISEENPPHNYQENRVAKGIAIDILLEMWKRLGLQKSSADIKFYPWARGYTMAQEQKGVCLFYMSITEPRKKLFKFVGPYNGPDVGVIAKKGRVKATSIEDLKKLKIGVKRDDIGEKLLLDTGTPMNIYPVVNSDQLVKMLDADRLDAISFSFFPAVLQMKKAGIDPAKYEMAYLMHAGIPGGYAFHKDTDQNLIDRLQKVFDELVKDGTVNRISNRYLGTVD